MSKEPVAYINAVSAILVGVLPVLAIFGVLNWTIEQFGAVETFVILVTGVASTLFTRSKVSPV